MASHKKKKEDLHGELKALKNNELCFLSPYNYIKRYNLENKKTEIVYEKPVEDFVIGKNFIIISSDDGISLLKSNETMHLTEKKANKLSYNEKNIYFTCKATRDLFSLDFKGKDLRMLKKDVLDFEISNNSEEILIYEELKNGNYGYTIDVK